MGIHENAEHDRKSRKSTRGSVNNANRLAGLGRGDASGGADWGGCNSEKLQAVVVGITELGGAVIIGMSRDKGAHSMTLLLDGSRETLWFNGNADLDMELDSVAAHLGALG